MPRYTTCLVLLLAAACCAPALAQDVWMTVLADGRKVGSAHTLREVANGTVTTTQHLALTFDRAGTRIEISSDETDVETTTGQPLEWRASTNTAGSASSVRATRLPDGRFHVTRTVAGHSRSDTVTWPTGAVLAEGQRLASVAHLRAVGAEVDFTGFDVRGGQALPTTRKAVADTTVTLPETTQRLLQITEVARLPVGAARSTLWLDSDGVARKIRLNVAGTTLVMLACSQACAEAPVQAADIFKHSMAHLPHGLAARELVGRLRYRIQSRDGAALHFATTDEQRVTRDAAGNWLVTVGAPDARRMTAPDAADTASNAWLQADNAEIIAAARKTTRGGASDSARMQRLTAFVRGYIDDKNLSVGYATALDTLHSRQGDCTEHAVLLAALARALHIPARVATGLAYAPVYAGAHDVLVPHAWVLAWVDGRWRSFDAALGRFDAGHIALGVGDGDPWRFFAGLDTLGRIDVRGVRVVKP